jgi:hypothetical protein
VLVADRARPSDVPATIEELDRALGRKTADVQRAFQPSIPAFKNLLCCFAFVDEVDVLTQELPFWATEYDIVVTLNAGENLDECSRLIDTALEMATQPWRTVAKCLVREHGPDGDARESVWRLGGDDG